MRKRILLVVTGHMEQIALGVSLGRLFPDAEFHATLAQGFTARPLQDPNPALPKSKAAELVHKLMGAALPATPGGMPYDFAIAVDDVELANEPETGPPDVGVQRIVAHFQQGVDLKLRELASPHSRQAPISQGKARQHPPAPSNDGERRRFLRERCSFHLLRPMAEALLFGDPRGPYNAADAGVVLPAVCFNPRACDIEAFQTADPAFLGHPDGYRPPGQNAEAPWAKARRARHPKRYLQYLLDPTGTIQCPYKEVEHGARALSALAWEQVVAPEPFAQMTRALLDDIADMVGVSLPWLSNKPLHPLTCRKSQGRLRNVE